MTRFADFTIYVLCGIVMLVVLTGVFGHSGYTALIFFRLLEFSMFALLTWAVVASCRKRQWWMAVIAALCVVIIASQILAPRNSPLGMHEGFLVILPLMMFQNASSKEQKIAVIFGSLIAAGVVVVNAGLVGFGTAATTISVAVSAALLLVFVERIRTRNARPAE